uniref:Uncharacterized protein n=1 Tax=Rhizophora mucronata TaxID=61149 RepID=A0A2P2IU42_RHIMU
MSLVLFPFPTPFCVLFSSSISWCLGENF